MPSSRFVLILMLHSVVAENLFAAEKAIPGPAQITSCSVESRPRPISGSWKLPRVGCKDLWKFLRGASVVSEETWLHSYSHVALSDTEGTLKVRSSKSVRWLLRPGGLGRLTYADGESLHLVKCCTKE